MVWHIKPVSRPVTPRALNWSTARAKVPALRLIYLTPRIEVSYHYGATIDTVLILFSQDDSILVTSKDSYSGLYSMSYVDSQNYTKKAINTGGRCMNGLYTIFKRQEPTKMNQNLRTPADPTRRGLAMTSADPLDGPFN